MSSQKLSRITNIWSRVIESENGSLSTKVVIEATEVIKHVVSRVGNDLILESAGVAVNMPEGLIEVNDGLVREIFLEQTGAGEAVVRIVAEHPCEYKVIETEGIPASTAVILNRAYLTNLMRNKKIVIDPGHGGDDWGGKGPVNLVEKNVVVLIARILADIFNKVGAQVFLTRTGDENIRFEKRFGLALKEKADLFIGIHTYSARNSKVSGASVRYKPSCDRSRTIAGMIDKELVKKLKVEDRGVKESPDLVFPGGVPGVEVEVVTITNWVEEGLLRSPTIHKKAAEGIFIGVKNYFAAAGQQNEVVQ
ncbi:MAG: N-acetylmuramoyl-L-alanine amidase LytC precursor [Pelotomaculum sp. PtaB.Bin013]|uniref:N-acetylmuramoyl-L-alanine amidase n=1 Tax=Pelotomaculum isophthalicicum JI TaxID=947010 RepID=A0A9X4H5M4_9FIRM|nr:N-acetylmuramoyl-L-alanine amidase [Pelotomaculum isophthalicicum]MDF9408582.1 N-acetylmuramoyl-L-alanine amidase [Pelotomaculum isophthalicicum JI]OPX81781.1 MAG: N-acetylmuramoyl-L-alanine amidase LytC precursor [Pelotomaculum sp. PtaB.Bin013]